MSAQTTANPTIPATAVREATMQAIVYDRYGGPEVLHLAEVARPTIADDEVLVRVRAAGIARGDWHVMTGRPYLVRVMGFGLRRPKQRVRGQDLAGTVESVGAAVTAFKPGDEVYGWGRGAYAEYAAAKASDLVRKPAGLSFEQAATVGISGMTAIQAVRDVGKVKPGTSVLVTGAGGGVGSFAVQIACAFGGTVTGASRATKHDLVRSLGASDVIDTESVDLTRMGRQWDVIIDTAGRRPLRRIRKALTPDGTLVLIGGEGGDRWMGGFDRHFRAMALSRFVRQDLKMLAAAERGEDLVALNELIEAGKLTPIIDRVYPLAEAADAMRHLESGRVAGKLVLPSRADRQLRCVGPGSGPIVEQRARAPGFPGVTHGGGEGILLPERIGPVGHGRVGPAMRLVFVVDDVFRWWPVSHLVSSLLRPYDAHRAHRPSRGCQPIARCWPHGASIRRQSATLKKAHSAKRSGWRSRRSVAYDDRNA